MYYIVFKTRQIFHVLRHVHRFLLPLAILHGQRMRQFIAVVSSSLYSSLFNEIVITRMTLHDLYCTLYTVLQGLCTGVVLSVFIFSPH